MSGVITKPEGVISQSFIKEVNHRLADNKMVRRTLPAHGRLHIDRKLPFLCVYRRPTQGKDHGTDRLVKGEASYLVASAAPKYKTGISNLINSILEIFSQGTGAFLIIEIWSRESPEYIIDPDKGRMAPSFRIKVPPSRIPVETIEAIEKALNQIIVSKKRSRVSTVYTNKPWPEQLPPLLTNAEIHKNNCYLVGIEISPIYRDPDTGEIYPLVLNKIHRGISLAFKKGAFEFSRKRTATKPQSYKSLGRRAVVKSVWEVDQKLADISNEMDFLLLVTPVNIEHSWRKFKAGKFKGDPVFFYRPVSFDPSLLKRKLYEIPFDRIEDPTIASLFHEKLVELEMKFSMVRDRNTRNFFFGSMQLYGEIDDKLLELAKNILKKISPHSRETGAKKMINAKIFAERARQEIGLYRETFPDIASKVLIREDTAGLLVSHGNLLINKSLQIPASRVEALIQHEVGTHVLTYVNGMNQPFQQLYCGFAGSDELQEGLAVLAEYLVGGLSAPRFRLLAGRVVAAHMLIEGSSFQDTFNELHGTFGFAQQTAYIITARIYRGGGFTKDSIYLRGLVNLIKYLRNGGELEPLLIGKISLDDISLINELRLRKVLHPSLLSPRYLSNPQSISLLGKVKQGQRIFNLI
ncbi:MAG: DUF1704 domain-containing protein [Bacteroidia bacterium]|nr:MAG: DUF1704 domain-containing protein [Bacteroidia bacterium]